MPLPTNIKQFIPNIPTPPSTAKNRAAFPNDLVADGRNFCTTINFMSYKSLTTLGRTMASSWLSTGSLTLPIPSKLNESQVLIWNEISQTDLAIHAGSKMAGLLGNIGQKVAGRLADVASSLSSLISVQEGMSINPHMWLQFKSPSFKEFTLTWSLIPNNEAESNTIVDIIDTFKFNSLPTESFLLYGYPNVVIIKFYPNDKFTFKIRPCVITSVSVDYTGAGSPSFFKSGAPTVVNFSVHLKEIELWSQNNYFSS